MGVRRIQSRTFSPHSTIDTVFPNWETKGIPAVFSNVTVLHLVIAIALVLADVIFTVVVCVVVPVVAGGVLVGCSSVLISRYFVMTKMGFSSPPSPFFIVGA